MPTFEDSKLYKELEELNEIASRMRRGLNEPADATEIKYAERRLGRNLPPSYRAFLLLTNGLAKGYLDLSFASNVQLVEGPLVLEFKRRIKEHIANKASIRARIISQKRDYVDSDFDISMMTPFATDFGGTFLVFNWEKMFNDEPEIVLWHTYALVKKRWETFLNFLEDS